MSLHQVDWGDGTPITSVPAGNPIADHVYNIVGTRTIIARSTEADGTTERARASEAITIPAGVLNSMVPNTGPEAGGTEVIIAGTGLTGTTGVFFGSNAATGVQVLSDGAVRCISPAGTGSPINVGAICRGTGTNNVQFNYIPEEEEGEAAAEVSQDPNPLTTSTAKRAGRRRG